MDSLQEKIARRAFELFQARGGQHGYHIEDWLQAEKEIKAGSSTSTSRTPRAKSAAPKKAATPAKKKTATATKK